MAGDFAVTAALCIAMALTFIFTGIFLFTFIRRGRMKTPVIIFLLSLSVADTIAALLWTIFTALSSTTGEWTLPDEICRMQVWFMGFCNVVNMYILLILMFERFLKFYMPSKHQEIVFDTVVLITVAAVCLLGAVIASFPVWGWGETAYFSSQYQCAVDYELHESQLHFTLVMHFVLPLVLIASFYAASLIKLRIIRRKLQPGQAIVLEENMEVQGDGYSERLKRQYAKFKNPGEKSKQPKVESRLDKDGFKRESDDSSSDSSSSDDEKQTKQKDKDLKFDGGGKETVKKKKEKKSKRKTHYLSRDDIWLVHMFGIVTLSYFLCWFLYIIQAYIYTYSPKTLGSTLVLASVCLSHFGSCIKVPIYLMYPRIRNCCKKSFRIGRDSGSKTDRTDAETSVQTTEL